MLVPSAPASDISLSTQPRRCLIRLAKKRGKEQVYWSNQSSNIGEISEREKSHTGVLENSCKTASVFLATILTWRIPISFPITDSFFGHCPRSPCSDEEGSSGKVETVLREGERHSGAFLVPVASQESRLPSAGSLLICSWVSGLLLSVSKAGPLLPLLSVKGRQLAGENNRVWC